MGKVGQQLNPKTVDALLTLVKQCGGDLASAHSELNDFQTSPQYRRGLSEQFRKQHGHSPCWKELVKHFFRHVVRRSKCFAHFFQQRNGAVVRTTPSEHISENNTDESIAGRKDS